MEDSGGMPILTLLDPRQDLLVKVSRNTYIQHKS